MNIKDAMSCFATGVTVVTTRAHEQDWGLTCSSFNTVSLDPVLVLWSIRRASLSHAAFVAAPGYVVNVLALAQQDLAMRFASGTQAERFAGLDLAREQGRKGDAATAIAANLPVPDLAVGHQAVDVRHEVLLEVKRDAA